MTALPSDAESRIPKIQDDGSAVFAAVKAGHAPDSHTMKLARAIDRQIDVTRKLIAARPLPNPTDQPKD